MDNNFFKKFIICLIFLTVVFIAAGPSFAEDNNTTGESLNGSLTESSGPGIVTNNRTDKNYTSIQSAINDASPDDTLLIGSGIYNEYLNISKNINLIGNDENRTILTYSVLYSCITIHSKINVNISNLSITNGNPTTTGTGGGINNGGILILNNIFITNNTASEGGGIYNTGNLTIYNSIINNNTARIGGGIYNTGNLTIYNSDITDNQANQNSGFGGGIYTNGAVIINNSNLNNNEAIDTQKQQNNGKGGAIYVDNNGSLTINNSALKYNKAYQRGGAIFNQGKGTLNVTNCYFFDNVAYDPDWNDIIRGFSGTWIEDECLGGAIYSTKELNITNSSFNTNHAWYGGAIYYDNASCALNVNNTDFYGNYASYCIGRPLGWINTVEIGGSGGAIDTANGNLIINNSIFSFNSGMLGGALYNSGNYNITVINSSFTNNTVNAVDDDGNPLETVTFTSTAFDNAQDGLEFVSSIFKFLGGAAKIFDNKTFEGLDNMISSINSIVGMFSIDHNTVEAAGGAIYLLNNCTLSINRSLFANNTGSVGGGICNFGTGAVNVTDSLFNTNGGGMGGAIYCNYLGPLNIVNNTFTGNAAGSGGAICYTGSESGDWGAINAQENIFYYNDANIGGTLYDNYQGNTKIHLNYNRIYGTQNYDIYNEVGKCDAQYNWWGSNNGPLVYNTGGNVTVEPYMVLNITSQPKTVEYGSNSTIHANMFYDNQGTYHNPAYGQVPSDGIPIYFYANTGNIIPENVTLSNGTANATFIAIVNTTRVILYGIVDNDTQYPVQTIITVTKIPTNIYMNPVSNLPGQNVTLFAKILDNVNNPVNEGNVTFIVGTVNAGTVQVIDGYAECYWTIPSGFLYKDYDITANYAGINYKSSDKTGTLTVNKPLISSTYITVGPPITAYYGDNVNLTATLTDMYGAPVSNKNLTFYLNDASIGSAITDLNGLAILPYKISLSAGTYNLAVTLINGINNPRNDGWLNVELNQATLVVNNITDYYGSNVNLTATLHDMYGNPVANKNVDFKINDTLVGSSLTNNNGIATLNYFLNNIPNVYNMTATFLSDGDYGSCMESGILNVLHLSEVYISPQGNDITGNGSNQSPLQTIGRALLVVDLNGTVHIANGTYNLADDYMQTITKNVTITGQNPENTIIDAQGKGLILAILYNVNATISNLKFINGNYPDGGAILNAGNLTLINCIFTNDTSVYGGAIYSTGNLNITNNTFNNNNAIQNGGAIAIYTSNSTNNILESTFNNNTAVYGGAVEIENWESKTETNITNSIFNNNTGILGGGGVDTDNTHGYTETTITNSIFNNNTAVETYGGAIFNDGNMTITNGTFTNNSALFGGGAIEHVLSVLNITKSTFTDNKASGYNENGVFYPGYGGAIENDVGATLNINESTLTYNYATNGGAISNGYTNASYVNAHFNRIVWNNATNGCAIYNENGAVNATLNWWGTNNIPSNTVNGTVTISPYLILLIYSDFKSPIYCGDHIILTTNLVCDNNYNVYNPSDGHVPDGIVVNYSMTPNTIASVNPNSTITKLGIAPVIFTAELPGTITVKATVDNENMNWGPYTIVGTTTHLTIENTTGYVNKSVNLTAILKNENGFGINNKTISFTVNGVIIGTADTNAEGIATIIYNPILTAGNYTTTAKFTSDNNNNYNSSEASGILRILGMDDVYISATGNDTTGNGTLENPFQTLAQALFMVNSNGIIHLANGIYNLAGDYQQTITKNLTITGQGSQNTIIDAQGKGPIFTILSSVNAIISNLTFNNGNYTNGGAVINSGYLTMDNCTFTNNTAQNGGAIYSTGTINLNNDTFNKNRAYLYGGAVEIVNSNSNIINCRFTNNNAANSGALSIFGGDFNEYETNITQCTFTNNTAFNGGGGIGFDNKNTNKIDINNSTFEHNSANNGGAIDISWQSSPYVSISNSTIINNNSTTTGGAISQLGGIFIITNTTLAQNTAGTDGGAIYCAGTLNITESTLSNNKANNGGAITFIDSNAPILHFNRIIGNIAINGSAFYNYDENDINATLNWWGSNDNPADKVFGPRILVTPWIVLNITANPNIIPFNGSSQITTNLQYDNNGTYHDPINGYIPYDGPANFSTTIGTINDSNFNEGQAQSNLRGTEPGNAIVKAVVDDQIVTTEVHIISADIEVNKSVDNSRPNVGDNVTFTVTVKNNGPDTATNIQITDIIPAGLSNLVITNSTGKYENGIWYIPELSNGANATLTINTIINANLAGLNITNTANKTAEDQFDPNPNNDESSASFYVPVVNMTITQKPWYYDSLAGTYQTWSDYNNVMIYIVEAQNTGDDATGIIIKDIIGNGYQFVGLTTEGIGNAAYDSSTHSITWNIGLLPKNSEAYLSIFALVEAIGNNTPELTVNASLNHVDQYDTPNGNKSSSWSIYVPVSADMQVNQTQQNSTESDGQYITYTTTVTNNGPNNASAIQITDILPAGLIISSVSGNYIIDSNSVIWTIDNLNVGENTTLTLKVKINGTGTFVNTVTKTAQGENDWNYNNNAQTCIFTVSGNYTPQVNMNVYQDPAYYDTATGTYQTESEYYKTIVYSVEVKNSGPTDATGVVVIDVLGDGYDFINCTTRGIGSATYDPTTHTLTWNVGYIPVGGKAYLSVFALVTAIGNNTPELTVNASLSHVDQNDTPNSYKYASYSIYVPSPTTIKLTDVKSNLYITGTLSNPNPQIGKSFIITFKLGNKGPGTAKNVIIKIPIPEGLEFISADVDQGTFYYNEKTRTLIWYIDEVPEGDPYLYINLKSLQTGSYVLIPSIFTTTYNLYSINTNLPFNFQITNPQNNISPVEAASTVSSTRTIGMQDTGLPIAGLILAILAVFAGLTTRKK